MHTEVHTIMTKLNISSPLYRESFGNDRKTLVTEWFSRDLSRDLALQVNVSLIRVTDRGKVRERFIFAKASDSTVVFSHLDVDYPNGEGYTHTDSTLDGRVLGALSKADLSLDVHAEASDGRLRSGGAPGYQDLHERALADEPVSQ